MRTGIGSFCILEARAQLVVDPTEAENVMRLLMLKYPHQAQYHWQCRPRRMSAYSAGPRW
jgi:hypothetical protein